MSGKALAPVRAFVAIQPHFRPRTSFSVSIKVNTPNLLIPSGLLTDDHSLASNDHQFPTTPSESYVETVFNAISSHNGKLNFKDLFTMLVEGGNTSRVHLYRAIAQLTKDGRIKRVKGIGKNGIDYFYYDIRLLKVRPSQMQSNAS